jgi:hypothetical protein
LSVLSDSPRRPLSALALERGVFFSWLYVPLVAVCSEVWSAIVSCWLAGGCVWVVLASRVVRVSPAQTGVRDVT